MNTLIKNNRGQVGLTQDVHVTALIASLFYMMTCYSRDKDDSLVKPILDNLEWLSVHPEVANSQLKEICTKLKKNWETMSSDDCEKISTFLH